MTKRLSLVAISMMILVVVAFFACKIVANCGKANQNIVIISQVVEDGDLIFRLGDRPWSMIIKDISEKEKKYSHVGIIRKTDKITVVNAETLSFDGKDCVIEETLDEFVDVAQCIGIYRYKSAKRSEISKMASAYLGRPFDWDFDINDNSKIYCSELVYDVLKDICDEIAIDTIYVKEIRKDVIPLDFYADKSQFDEILVLEMKR